MDRKNTGFIEISIVVSLKAKKQYRLFRDHKNFIILLTLR
jgi:hypothetical protein